MAFFRIGSFKTIDVFQKKRMFGQIITPTAAIQFLIKQNNYLKN